MTLVALGLMISSVIHTRYIYCSTVHLAEILQCVTWFNNSLSAYNITLGRVRATFVAVGKQYILLVLILCLQP